MWTHTFVNEDEIQEVKGSQTYLLLRVKVKDTGNSSIRVQVSEQSVTNSDWLRTMISNCNAAPSSTIYLYLLCPPHWGVDILFLLFPPSGVPLGFQTF